MGLDGMSDFLVQRKLENFKVESLLIFAGSHIDIIAYLGKDSQLLIIVKAEVQSNSIEVYQGSCFK